MLTGLKKTLLDSIHSLKGLPAPQSLPSKRDNRDLLGDLLSLNSAVYSDSFDTARARPFLDAVFNKHNHIISQSISPSPPLRSHATAKRARSEDCTMLGSDQEDCILFYCSRSFKSSVTIIFQYSTRLAAVAYVLYCLPTVM